MFVWVWLICCVRWVRLVLFFFSLCSEEVMLFRCWSVVVMFIFFYMKLISWL